MQEEALHRPITVDDGSRNAKHLRVKRSSYEEAKFSERVRGVYFLRFSRVAWHLHSEEDIYREEGIQ